MVEFFIPLYFGFGIIAGGCLMLITYEEWPMIIKDHGVYMVLFLIIFLIIFICTWPYSLFKFIWLWK